MTLSERLFTFGHFYLPFLASLYQWYRSSRSSCVMLCFISEKVVVAF